MTDPRWTDATEETIARRMAEVDRHRCDTVDEVWRGYGEQARAALAALADAGLLLPPGVETREEWRVHGNPGQGYGPSDRVFGGRYDDDPESSARRYMETLARSTGTHGAWVDGPHLIHRTVHLGPWRPADIEGAKP